MPPNCGIFESCTLATSTSIRLVRSEHDVEANSSIYSFEVVDLLDPPDYTAVSYCWGDPQRSEEIRWKGGKVSVGRSVKDLLGSFGEKSPLLWIDALCINQEDTAERNQQVMLMADIYREAKVVDIWLGQDERGHAHFGVQKHQSTVRQPAIP